MNICISVEGNIGAGKSSLLYDLAPLFAVMTEPWEEFAQEIEDYHLHPSSVTAQELQSAALKAICSCMRSRECILYERSPSSCTEIFAPSLQQMGLLNAEFVENLRLLSANDPGAQPTHYLYIWTTPLVAFARTKQRARIQEAGMQSSYVQLIHDAHETFLNPQSLSPPAAGEVKKFKDNVLAINGDQSQHGVLEDARAALYHLTSCVTCSPAKYEPPEKAGACREL